MSRTLEEIEADRDQEFAEQVARKRDNDFRRKAALAIYVDSLGRYDAADDELALAAVERADALLNVLRGREA